MLTALKWFSILFLTLIVVGTGLVSVLIIKPWQELQPWRWYTLAIEAPRAELFSNWKVIQPHVPLVASSQPRQFQRNLVPVTEISYEFEGRVHSLEDYLNRANVTGFMVVRDDTIQVEYYGRGYNQETRSHIWSATKSFMATLVGQGLHEGVIDSLDDPVEKYAPAFKGTAYGETSLAHLLTMSSGVAFNHFGGQPNRNDLYQAIIQNGESFNDWAAALGRRVPAGSDYNYLATDSHVLSVALSGAYQMPLAQIMQEKLWEPGGFSAAYWGQDATGVTMGHCCLSIRLYDFANLGYLYLNDLTLNGQPTTSPEWFNRVERAQKPFNEPGASNAEFGWGYSSQFWLPEDYDQEFIAVGAFDQYLWIDRKRGFVVAQFGTGQSLLFPDDTLGASPAEVVTVMRAMADLPR